MKDLVGLTVDAANDKAAESGLTIRPTKVDGNACVGTCDYVTTRVNVYVEKGIVTQVTGRG